MPVPASSYNANIPQSTDQLSVSQGQLLNNFGALQTLVDVNHADFASAQAGKHIFVEFPTQSPVPTTVGGEVGLYSQVSTLTSQPELVFSHQLSSTAPVGARIVEFTSAGWSANGWARLPSGILLKWGQFNLAAVVAPQTVTYPTGVTIPAFNQIFNVNISLGYASSTTALAVPLAVSTSIPPTITAFTVTYSGIANTSTYVNYIAIGV